MTAELCGVIHRMCSHVNIKCGLPKGHNSPHMTLIQFVGGKESTLPIHSNENREQDSVM